MKGPNGIQVLRKLGILDQVLHIADEPLAMRTFLFLSGLPDHNIIYDVKRFPFFSTNIDS